MNDGCEKEVEVEYVQVRECRECLRRRFMNGDNRCVGQKKRQKKSVLMFKCAVTQDVPNKRCSKRPEEVESKDPWG